MCLQNQAEILLTLYVTAEETINTAAVVVVAGAGMTKHIKYASRIYPGRILLQWHITDRCNLRCSHCYQNTYSGAELSLDHLLFILDQFRHFLKLCGSSVKGHITVTGGEPFARNDFPDLLEIFTKYKNLFSFAILTNGTLIDRNLTHYLKKIGLSFVQVSIEGTKFTHDNIRGTGNFEKTVAAINHLVKAGARVLISFTAHRNNFREFEDVAILGRKLRVSRVWADRLIPQGIRASDLQSLMLTKNETLEFFKIMNKAKTQAKRSWFNHTEIALNRSLQFLVTGKKPYRCAAGDTLITVMPNGDLYPCRRMPERVGNLFEKDLSELYFCDFFEFLRNPNLISKGCEDCFYFKFCKGGLKCLSYAVKGDPFYADPGCIHAKTGQ
jgi:radical SAM protein with 4Fe4S-binding SPASM domain